MIISLRVYIVRNFPQSILQRFSSVALKTRPMSSDYIASMKSCSKEDIKATSSFNTNESSGGASNVNELASVESSFVKPQFPFHGLLPKKETQALSFLELYPEYDGRSIKVGILDTGVDPLAAGLRETPSGSPKVIDCIDCNGSGDVDMSTERETDPISDGSENLLTIEGLSGRKLRVPKSWKNPSGKFRVGLKSLWSLFPSELMPRVKSERNKLFDAESSKIRSVTLKKYESYLENMNQSNEPTQEQKTQVENLSGLMTSIDKLEKLLPDEGPIIDCLSWYDGDKWMAALDLSCDGDMQKSRAMAAYSHAQECSMFDEIDQLTYSFNFYDNGNTLSIVTMSNLHGTHVAGIVGAYFSENSELNGLAPGSQIVSLKIGDQRLDGLETGQAFTRAARAIIDHKIDILNISFGEDPALPNVGKMIEALRELCTEHNVVIVSSAGNSGPCLSTVGAPGGTTSGVISVGAYVSAPMMKAGYSLIDPVSEQLFTWSSRGPASDGAQGVTIFAPGGAITCFPKYMLTHSSWLNGTSMSSPNACGSIALILSALKQQNIKYLPARIVKAVQYTSKDIGDPSKVGMLQVSDAYRQIWEHKDIPDQDMTFKVKILENGMQNRGIYIREQPLNQKTVRRVAEISVHLPCDRKSSLQEWSQYVCFRPTKSWIRCIDSMMLVSETRRLVIELSLDEIEFMNDKQSVAFEFIDAFDYNDPSRKLFSIPVTVINPEKIKQGEFSLEWSQKVLSGEIFRKFIEIPQGCNKVNFSVRRLDGEMPKIVTIHANQTRPQTRASCSSVGKFVEMTRETTEVLSLDVSPGYTCEIVTCLYWSAPGPSILNVRAEFEGLEVQERSNLELLSGSIKKYTLKNSLKPYSNDYPQIILDRSRTIHRPTQADIRSLDERDILPNGKELLALVITYDLEVDEETKISYSLPVSGELYDSPFYSCLATVLNSNGKQVSYSTSYNQTISAAKGSYKIIVQLTHWKKSILENNKNMILIIDRSLKEKIAFSPYATKIDVINKDSPLTGKCQMKNGETRVFWYNLDKEDMPSKCLIGTFSSLSVMLQEAPARKFKEVMPEKPDWMKKSDETPNALDVQIKALKEIAQFGDKVDKDELLKFEEYLISKYPSSIELKHARLAIEKDESQKLKLAEDIINNVNLNECLEILARVKSEDDSKEDILARKRAEKDKAAIIDALYVTSHENDRDLKTLQKLVDTKTDAKAAWSLFQSLKKRNEIGKALKIGLGFWESNKNLEKLEQSKLFFESLQDIFNNLGWQIWEERMRLKKLIEHPPIKARKYF